MRNFILSEKINYYIREETMRSIRNSMKFPQEMELEPSKIQISIYSKCSQLLVSKMFSCSFNEDDILTDEKFTRR